MIKVKESVRPKNLVIMAAVANVAEQLKVTALISSGNDGEHMPGSKHYSYDALDVRSKLTFKTWQEKEDFIGAVLKRLGPKYQGLLENYGEPNEHFHFEYDPD